MVAGGIPTVQALLDDGTGTFPYDISSKTRVGYAASRGRADELSTITAGTLTLTVDNTDGRFTPGSTIIAAPSPIKADARIRVKVTTSGTVNRFTGYVQSWPVAWPTGSDTLSEVTITATDAQARGERQTLKSVIEQEIAADSSTAYYPLGEPAGATSAADSSGNQAAPLAVNGSGAAVVFGSAAGPVTAGSTGATFAAGQQLRATLAATPAALECWFSTTTVSATDGSLLGTNSASGPAVTSGNLTSAGVGSAGAVADGLIHHVVWAGASIYLDGVLTGLAGQAITGTTLVIGQAFTGSIFHVAAYSVAPSAARVLAHYQAGATGFTGESGTARITRLAGYASLPLGTLDTSLTNVPFVDITSKSASGAIGEVADAEMGLTFHDGSGNLTFHNRQRVPLKLAADVTVAANQLDPGTAFTTDMQGVYNYFEVTALGSGNGAQVVLDATSQTSHGRYPGSASYLVSTDQEALDRGNWIIYTRKEPGPRVGTLVVDMLTLTAAQQATLVAVEPNTWVQVTGLPSQTPGGTTANLIVQGFTDTLTKDDWTLALNVVDKTTRYPNVWILDNATYSVLDSTTRLYV